MLQRVLIKIFVSFCCIASSIVCKSQEYKNDVDFKKYLIENNQKLDPIEGIWEFNKKVSNGFRDNDKSSKNIQFPSYNIDVAPYKVAIVKNSTYNFICYKLDFFGKLIEMKGCGDFAFRTTAIDNQYIYDVNPSCKESYHDKAFIKSNGDLSYSGKFEEYQGTVFSWNNFSVLATKLSPTTSEIRNYQKQVEKPKSSLGTGFAISNTKIMTCYHVVKDAKQILIKGINGYFGVNYSAKVVYSNEQLDIAILEFENNVILGITSLPYKLKLTPTEVGTDIFVLGYPLQNTMGEEIKLTTGIVSSNSGFKNDTTLFQVSAPIQPGNSGGPLFDYKGNVIGLVTAKHLKADNVGYATKIYLERAMLKEISLKYVGIKTPLSDLPTKVKMYKNYIYAIEVKY